MGRVDYDQIERIEYPVIFDYGESRLIIGISCALTQESLGHARHRTER
jgi:hypothetical protein